jgi:transposase-like protein
VASTALRPAYKRLTDDQRILILQLSKQGLTQAAIAQQLGCHQTTVSDWLSKCQDTTSVASTYLKGSALRMARNIVERGLARDHVAALKGIQVLKDETDTGRAINLVVNGLVQIGIGQPSPVVAEVPSESLQITEGN